MLLELQLGFPHTRLLSTQLLAAGWCPRFRLTDSGLWALKLAKPQHQQLCTDPVSSHCLLQPKGCFSELSPGLSKAAALLWAGLGAGCGVRADPSLNAKVLGWRGSC